MGWRGGVLSFTGGPQKFHERIRRLRRHCQGNSAIESNVPDQCYTALSSVMCGIIPDIAHVPLADVVYCSTLIQP